MPGLVLLGVQAHGGRLDPHRQVLADHRDVPAVGGEAAGDGQDPGVVVPQPEAGRQHGRVGVVELDPQRPAVVPDRDGRVEPAVLHPQVVEQAQRLAGEVPELGVVPLGLELGDHHDRQDDLVLGEPHRGARVRQQHRGVEDERAPRRLREQLGLHLGGNWPTGSPLGRTAGAPAAGAACLDATASVTGGSRRGRHVARPASSRVNVEAAARRATDRVGRRSVPRSGQGVRSRRIDERRWCHAWITDRISTSPGDARDGPMAR